MNISVIHHMHVVKISLNNAPWLPNTNKEGVLSHFILFEQLKMLELLRFTAAET
jgi:hypothetical protein